MATSVPLALNGPLLCLMMRARSSFQVCTTSLWSSFCSWMVTVRKAFGFGSSVMGMNAFDDQTVSLAFPGVTLGGIPAAVGGATAREDDDTRRALVENEAAGPWRLAGSATYDEVIDPRELRTALLAGLRTAGARLTGPVAPVERVGYLP